MQKVPVDSPVRTRYSNSVITRVLRVAWSEVYPRQFWETNEPIYAPLLDKVNAGKAFPNLGALSIECLRDIVATHPGI